MRVLKAGDEPARRAIPPVRYPEKETGGRRDALMDAWGGGWDFQCF